MCKIHEISKLLTFAPRNFFIGITSKVGTYTRMVVTLHTELLSLQFACALVNDQNLKEITQSLDIKSNLCSQQPVSRICFHLKIIPIISKKNQYQPIQCNNIDLS